MANLVEKAKNLVSEKLIKKKTPEAYVTDVDLEGVSPDAVTYIAKVSVKNPYRVSIPISEISYTLKSAGRLIATDKLHKPETLPAKDAITLNVPVKVPHDVMLSLVRDLGVEGNIDYELELDVIVDLPVVGGFTIPISTKGQIKLPTLSDLLRKEYVPMSSQSEVKLPILSSLTKNE